MKTVLNVDDLLAGKKFRETLEHRADAFNGVYPLWHGWAILDAFLAGAEYARAAIGDGAVVPRKPTEAMIEAGKSRSTLRGGYDPAGTWELMLAAAHQSGGDGVVVPEWQPIETAPKDGTDILLCDVRAQNIIMVAGWHYDDGGFPWHTQDGQYNKDAFTHWMPLPAAPQSGGDKP